MAKVIENKDEKEPKEETPAVEASAQEEEEAVVSDPAPATPYNPYDKRARRLDAILNGSTAPAPEPVTSDVTDEETKETEEVKE